MVGEAPTNHPMVMQDKCKRCGADLEEGHLYTIIRQKTRSAPKQDPVCLECIGDLLLSSERFLEALSKRLLGLLDKEHTPSG